MEWKDRFSVDLHEVDAQRQTLAGCNALVETAVTTRWWWSAARSAARRHADFAQKHFAVEVGERTGALANMGEIAWARRFHPKPRMCALEEQQ